MGITGQGQPMVLGTEARRSALEMVTVFRNSAELGNRFRGGHCSFRNQPLYWGCSDSSGYGDK
jgi:hypothetical protein